MDVVEHGGWLVLAEPPHDAHPVAAAVGALAVEVIQIQFIAVGVPGLGHGCLGPWLCRLRRLWKPSTYFLREAGLLDNFSTSSLFLAVTSDAHTSVYSCFWKDFTHILLLAVKIWTLFLRAPRIRQAVLFFAQCLARQWTRVMRQLLGAFGRFAHISFVKVNSDPEVDSCPALLVVFVSRRLEKCAQTMLQFARAGCA